LLAATASADYTGYIFEDISFFGEFINFSIFQL